MYGDNENEDMNNAGIDDLDKITSDVDHASDIIDNDKSVKKNFEESQTNQIPKQNQTDNANSQAQEAKTEKSRKKGSLFKKVTAIIASAALFGCVAGGTMAGVNKLISSDTFNIGSSQAVSESAAVGTDTTIADSSKDVTTAGNNIAKVQTAVLTDASSIVAAAMPSIVAINGTSEVTSDTWFGPQTYDAKSSGSGIIIGENDDELLIVTNNHVVQDIKTLSVTFMDNNTANASIKGRDSDSDIAILAISKKDIKEDTMSKITIAEMGDSDTLKAGQGVVAIGNALGYGQSVTVGCISAVDRDVQIDQATTKNLLQTDAAINPGNSGGALLDFNGKVIGINSAKYSSTEVEGMGYAIPISKVQDIITNLSSKTTRVQVPEDKQGYIGIQGQNIDDEMAASYNIPKGIYVYKILDSGAAANSELQEKDIITKLDGQSVSTMEELKDMLLYYAGNDEVKLTVQRPNGSEYNEITVSVKLGLKPVVDTQ